MSAPKLDTGSAVEDRESAIDETPISPVRPGHVRQNSLEKHLQHRPDPQELKDRHILLDTNAAPSVQAKQVALEHRLAADHLKHDLEKRPQREELVERGILPDPHVSSAIITQQKELSKHMRADSLNAALQHRPEPEQLVKEGILEEDPRSPVLGATDAKNVDGNAVDVADGQMRSAKPGVDYETKDGGDLTQKEKDEYYEERMEEEYAKREGGA